MCPSARRGEIYTTRVAEDDLRKEYTHFKEPIRDPIYKEYAIKVIKEKGEISFAKFSGHIINIGLEKFRQSIHILRDIGGEYDNLYKFIYLRIFKVIEIIPSEKFVYDGHRLEIHIINLRNDNEYSFIYKYNGESELKGPDDDYRYVIPDFVRVKILWDIEKAKEFYRSYYGNLWEVRENE